MKNLTLLAFTILTLGFYSCKKDKDESQSKYTLMIAEGNTQTEFTGTSTQKSVTVKIMQGNQTLPFKNINADLEVVTPNCVIDAFFIPNRTPQYSYTVNADGTLNVKWYTGNTVGTQTITILLKEIDTKQTLASTQTSINVAANPSGFYATCLKHKGRIIALGDNHFVVRGDFYHFESFNAGLTWGEGTATSGSSEFARIYLEGKKAKDFSYYHAGKNTLYANFGMALLTSTNYGITWELACRYDIDGSTRVLTANNYLGFIETNKLLMSNENSGLYLYEIRENQNDTFYYVNPLPDVTSGVKLSDGSVLANNSSGIVYKANNLTDNFTSINTNFVCDYLFKDNNGAVYGFSTNAIYQYNGSSFNKIADIDLPQNYYVNQVVDANGLYYIATYSERYSNLGMLYSGSNMGNLTPTTHLLNRENYQLTKSANGMIAFQNQFGFYQLKK
ncbi:MAG: hypothetical protein ACK44D_06815 [Bacteroidia bacterium]